MNSHPFNVIILLFSRIAMIFIKKVLTINAMRRNIKA
nr:MAG TPA: hypothetical protein [Caudoviricetes sp.]